MCTGDLNKLVGNIIPGNSPKVSLGGKLLRKLLDTGNWILVNGLGSEIVKGGPYTRQDPDTGNQSCLDFIVSKNMLPFIDTLVIDSDSKMTPARAVKHKKKYKLIYSDHFSCLLNLKNLPKKKRKLRQRKKPYGILQRKMVGKSIKIQVMNLQIR